MSHENDKLNEIIDDRICKSHMAISQSISNFGGDLKNVSNEINRIKVEAVQHSNEHAIINMKLDGIDKKLESFITYDQFWPVKTIVYGCLGIVLTAIVIAGVGIIMTSNSFVEAESQEIQ